MKRPSIRKIKIDRIKAKKTEVQIAKEISRAAIIVLILAGTHWIVGTPKPWFIGAAACMFAYSLFLTLRERWIYT